MKAETDTEKMKIAQKTGVAVFKWDNVLGHEQFGVVTEAAKALQKQIDSWGLKDVTIVGHSKGGKVIEALLQLYQDGKLNKNEVRGAVSIDPPQGIPGLAYGGNPRPDALKAEVPTVSLPSQISCTFRPPGRSNIVHDVEFYPGVNNHEIQSHMAAQAYLALAISGHSHARPVAPGW
jgi:pimeloyl-ACP methyl ester carboxylesterase